MDFTTRTAAFEMRGDMDGRTLVGQVRRFDPVIGHHIAPLFSMDADGSDVVQVFNCEIGRPRFSPDGSRIAFSLAMDDGARALTGRASCLAARRTSAE